MLALNCAVDLIDWIGISYVVEGVLASLYVALPTLKQPSVRALYRHC